MSPIEVVAHDLGQARAALAAASDLGCEVQLRSAPGAAAYAGVGYLKALGDAAGHELLIDCADDAGLVMAALRTGCRKLTFLGSADLAVRLADLASQCGASFRYEIAPPDMLLLDPDAEPRAALEAWLRSSAGPWCSGR